jgi:mannose-6-phosphate isomerase-like protein (cupin superfamily)
VKSSFVVYPGHKSKVIETDDIKIFRTISTSSIQKGRIEIKSYAEKPLARNDDNKEMIFEVISGKCIITMDNVKFDLRANDTFIVPAGCVYYIINNQKSKLTLIYTIIGV